MSKIILSSTIKYILEQSILHERSGCDIHKDVSDLLSVGTVRQIIKRPTLYIEEPFIKSLEKRKKKKMICRKCGIKTSISSFMKLYGFPPAHPEADNAKYLEGNCSICGKYRNITKRDNFDNGRKSKQP